MDVIWVGTEVTASSSIGQILEIVVITTTDGFLIKNVSPTYITKRNIDRSLTDARYNLYSKNGLLDVADNCHRSELQVEDLLLDHLPPKCATLPTCYFSVDDLVVLRHRMPTLMSRLTGRPVFCNVLFGLNQDPVQVNKFSQTGRALEDLIQTIGTVKRLVNMGLSTSD